jgi:hypothetical protein
MHFWATDKPSIALSIMNPAKLCQQLIAPLLKCVFVIPHTQYDCVSKKPWQMSLKSTLLPPGENRVQYDRNK